MSTVVPFKVGDDVSWKWMGRLIIGKVKKIYFESVTIEIKGKNIKRIGSKEKPAYLVESNAGNIALKLQTEIQAYKKSKSKMPTMFGD